MPMHKLGLLLFACSIPLWAGELVITQQGETIVSARSSAVNSLLFTYVTNQFGFETEITISNTSQDSLGSTPQTGTCTVNYYGAAFIGHGTSAAVPAGAQLIFTLSQGGGGLSGLAITGGFSGYVIASCGFPLARGIAKVYGGNLAFSSDAQLVTTPRSAATPQFLFFPFITNQAGFDTAMALSNTSADPLGTSPASGACTMNFYGNSTFAVATPIIPAGTTYVTLASVIAPNFPSKGMS
jgi:hypothetical protein